jgi:uncharacterized protein (UPF0332 family)
MLSETAPTQNKTRSVYGNKSIGKMAEVKRQRAQDLFDNAFFEESIVSSYTSMFQAARALLFHDGVIEKSHACVVAYLREHY